MTGLHSPLASPISDRQSVPGDARPRQAPEPGHGAAIPFISCGGPNAVRNAAEVERSRSLGRTSFLPLGSPLSDQAPAGASASAFLFL